MISPQMIQLIERLHGRTAAEGLPWQETEVDGVYQITFPTFSVSLSKRPSQHHDADNDYWISIYNSSGKLIDEISDMEFPADFVLNGKPPYLYMEELYEMARRTAMGVEGVLSQILAHLG
jgi:hypothetical protein